MLSLFCGFPLGHNGNSAVHHQTLICYLMPVSLKKQELSALLVSVPPPYTAWLQNMQTDRASLDSPVCVPASDASPQLQTNSVSPSHYSCCGLIPALVCVSSNWHMHMCTHVIIYTVWSLSLLSSKRHILTSCKKFVGFSSQRWRCCSGLT